MTQNDKTDTKDLTVAESRDFPGEWRVEEIDVSVDGDGQVYLAIFTGPDAKEQAEAYYEWRR